ncbi:hypothetical protein RB213_009539 [Colletotrichum asianum]
MQIGKPTSGSALRNASSGRLSREVLFGQTNLYLSHTGNITGDRRAEGARVRRNGTMVLPDITFISEDPSLEPEQRCPKRQQYPSRDM